MSGRRVPLAGAGLVALAAGLWGTDALFRRGLALRLPAVEVVMWEHVILAALTVPLVLRGARRLQGLGARDWVALVVIGGGSSVAATVLFTEAFRHGDPNTPLLLQKLQPVFAAAAAWALLGERLRPRWFVYLGLALTGAVMISVRDPAAADPADLLPAALGAGAAALWALGTVLGKHVSGKLDPLTITGLRFCLGLPVAALLFLALEGEPAASVADLPAIVGLAFVPGLLALVLYYRGLAGTTASAATLAELAFPVSAVAVNAVAFGVTLSATQLTGAVLLAATITYLGLTDRSEPVALSVQPDRLDAAGARRAPA
ncbi:MAG TPA: DMT family transporter [Solirubrobacteraceae bacterium]|nr:DMT family transporter [Solirubrobacteraceae bacterium]